MDEQKEVNEEQAAPAVGQPQETPSENPAGTMQPDAVMVFLSYFGIFALIPLLTVKDNEFVKWHAKQGVTFFVATVVAYIVLAIVSAIMAFIPVVGTIIGVLIWLLLLVGSLGLFVLWIMALVKAFGGEKWEIPVVGDLAKRW